MTSLSNLLLRVTMLLLIVTTMLATVVCSIPQSLPQGAIGNLGRYNYSPSVIEAEGIRQFWWCSEGVNPAKDSQDTDAIYYESMNMTTLKAHGPVLVLAETPGGWDSAFTCNPRVIAGKFQNPLGDGQTYSYAMYYVATPSLTGLLNSIGVAFSNDGLHWKKYPKPVISPAIQAGYGIGQPAVYNSDHQSSLRIFYEDSYPIPHHVAAISSDGVHFIVQGNLTTNGLDPEDSEATWGDMAYEPKAGDWYAVFNRPLRPASVTGGIIERGQYGVRLFKIPQSALLTGGSQWQQLATMEIGR